MAEPKPTLPPICKRCGRFLRGADELRLGYCSRCPIPASDLPAADDEPFCCASDPPCPACPNVVGWDE